MKLLKKRKERQRRKRRENLTQSYEDWAVETLRQDKKEAAMYLQYSIEEYQKDGDRKVLLMALNHVAKAYGGFSELSKNSNLNRESLYKSLSPTGNPKITTFFNILKALGFKLSIIPD